MNPLIKPQELAASFSNPELVLIDARSGPTAKEKYTAEHLQGALLVDLETDLAHKSAAPAQGGRHPLPPIASFAELLGQLGINASSHVVVYDDKYGANAAARFWWMLRAIGHAQVQVLDGGYDAAVAAGLPTRSRTENAMPQPPYSHTNWQLPTVSMAEVDKAAQDKDYLVIDVREPARFRGETEPIDLVAGHIPGAVNIPFASNLDSSGSFLAPEALREKYTEAIGSRAPEKVTVHCGSGVTACHTLLAMDQAGLPMPSLYVGSWSEWSRNDKPIATGS